jgi:hypothetical protein
MTFRGIVFAVPLFFCAAATATEPVILLGVLEDRPGVYAGEADRRVVRAVFHKAGGDWTAFRHDCRMGACLATIAADYPPQVTWTISFNGRALGRVTARTLTTFPFYADVGQQEITSAGGIPTIGKRSTQYSGFLDTPVYRPLVAVSRPYVADPDQWKPAPLSTTLSAILRREFREKFPEVANCTAEDEVARPWPYRDEDIKLVKTYASGTGWSLAQLKLQTDLCDGPPDPPFVDQWFVIDPQGRSRFLDAGMWLVDAGDYDNDGKSELIFSIDRYNRGGYELFYGDFEKRAMFEFGYH